MELLNEKQVNEVIELLESVYPEADCELSFASTFQLLIAVVLSAQTTDKSVNQVTKILFEDYPDLEALLHLDTDKLELILKRVGMYKTKARHVVALCKMLKEEFNGEVPETFDELVRLPGVGRKTANVVLSNAFGQPAIAVDTHVFRVANRIGLVQGSDPLKTELALMQVLPREKWSLMHHLLIWHGRRQCFARNPACTTCGLKYLCKMNMR
jgi:endonuclease-3